jgi:Sulfotransferase family
MTIVTQFLNHHDDIKIFDEIDLIQINRGPVTGTLAAFLLERGAYQAYLRRTGHTDDPAVALRTIMGELARPCSIWGEKNPRYAAQLPTLQRTFPGATVLFVLRDPREVVNSCLLHRDSSWRADTDFWIKDTVAEALAQVENCLAPIEAGAAELVVLRFEAFAARPAAALAAALGNCGLTFSADAASLAHPAPETAGGHQFFRGGTALPWKAGNLSPLRTPPAIRGRFDVNDPAWAKVDTLARHYGYN